MTSNLTDQRHKLQPLAGKQVVVADPNPVMRTVLRDTAYSLGAGAVSYCASAIEVLRAVAGHDVQVILCEFQLDEQRNGQHLLEELRAKRLVPLSTVFIMVTAERTYRQVVSVAEFAPDDYLIKPFTQEQLRMRLVRANEKKHVLARAYAHLEAGEPDLAVRECKRVAAAVPRFFADACRLGVDVLCSLERFDEAEAMLDKVLAAKPLAWALMALARIRHQTGRLAEAEEVLHGVIAGNESLLSAYDLLATVKEEMGKDDEALEVLEHATSISSSNVERLRRTGAVARRVGRFDLAENSYTKVVDRVRDSSLLEGADFANLSGVLVAQGKNERVQTVVAEQKKLMRGHPEAEFVGKLMEAQQAVRAKDAVAAGAALDRLQELIDTAQAPVAAPLQFQVAEVSFEAGRADQGCKLAETIAQAPGATPRLVERAQALMADHRETPAPARPLDLDGVARALDRLARHGWENRSAERVFEALQRAAHDAKEGTDAHGRVAVMLQRFEALKANYGIVPDAIEP